MEIVLMFFLGTSIMSAQTEFSYRIINENVFTYNVISENSLVNPDNLLHLNELEIVNRFFPVGTFKKNNIKLQAEPKIFLNPLDELMNFTSNMVFRVSYMLRSVRKGLIGVLPMYGTLRIRFYKRILLELIIGLRG